MRAVIVLTLLVVCVMAVNARFLQIIEVEDVDKAKTMPMSSPLKPRFGETVSTIYDRKPLSCADWECQFQCWLLGYIFGVCADATHCKCWN